MRAILLAGLLISVVAGVAVAAGDDEARMAATASGFYKVYQTFHPSDGIPSDADRAKYAPFLSPALERLLGDAEAAESRFAKANKDSPPLIEGDIFSSLFEGASSVAVGTCSGDSARGRCIVKMESVGNDTKPVAWSDTILLVNTPAGWRVDDIAYGGSWAFGNKGKLSDLLRQALSLQ